MIARFGFRFFERQFALVCVTAVALGLGLPALHLPGTAAVVEAGKRFSLPLLAGILFFTGLKLDFATALRELRRPLLLVYLAAMLLLALPLGMWALARWLLPDFALGVLILAAMPAGMACATMSDIVRGNASLAMVLTLLTSLACPLTVPLAIGLVWSGGHGSGGAGFLLRQSLFLAATLFSPMAAAVIVRRVAPAFVARHREQYTGLSIVSLALLIVTIMASVSDQTLGLVRSAPWRVGGLVLFILAFTAIFYAVGFWLTPWRPMTDRAAVSICSAYVNNGLALVFARTFWVDRIGVESMLPAILLEAPMVLAIPLIARILRPHLKSGPGPLLATEKSGPGPLSERSLP
ncbi:MAG: hypothetical protein BIFFINMI_04372 [Phycisphaerae bacterium]|nr:hypothetical protein [Phycisphaerae bacterium]